MNSCVSVIVVRLHFTFYDNDDDEDDDDDRLIDNVYLFISV